MAVALALALLFLFAVQRLKTFLTKVSSVFFLSCIIVKLLRKFNKGWNKGEVILLLAVLWVE